MTMSLEAITREGVGLEGAKSLVNAGSLGTRGLDQQGPT